MENEKKSINKLLEGIMVDFSSTISSANVLGAPLIIDEERAIIPISRLTIGISGAGTNFSYSKKKGEEYGSEAPLAGGTIGGVLIKPEAFLLVSGDTAKLIKLENSKMYEKVIDLVTELMKKKRDK